MRTRSFTLTLAVIAIAVGCGSAPRETDTTAANRGGTGSADQTSGGLARNARDNTARADACNVTAVYFGYDSSDLDARARDALASNARCLQQQSGSARITGMTDPRGTEEYNLALGDRRAQTVKQYMSNMGVDESRLLHHSVGEERASGDDESGWASDRRADIRLQ